MQTRIYKSSYYIRDKADLELNTGFNQSKWLELNKRPILSSLKPPNRNKELGRKIWRASKIQTRPFRKLDKLEFIFKEQNKDLGQNVLIDCFG
jgi:hypothetical protein